MAKEPEKEQEEPPSKLAMLSKLHLFIVTGTATQNSLMWKCFAAFSGFIHLDYGMSYASLTSALAIATLTSLITLFLLPKITSLPCNLLLCLLQLGQCLGLFLLWYFRENYIVFVAGLAILVNAFSFNWGIVNSLVAAFIADDGNHSSSNNKGGGKTEAYRLRFLSVFNSSWTIATFLFLAVGLVLKYLSFWGFLQIMFCSGFLFALLNLLFIPRKSIDAQNQLILLLQLQSMSPRTQKQRREKHSSLLADIKVLFHSKVYTLLAYAFCCSLLSWGMFYVTFGPWIIELFEVDPAQLGFISALIEGFGNMFAILALTYFGAVAKNTSFIVLLSSIVIALSVIAMCLLTNFAFLEALLNNEWVIFFLIFVYFVGNEGCIVGMMILQVELAPAHLQARSSGIMTFINSTVVFVANLGVGYLFSFGGMRLELTCLVAVVLLMLFLVVCLYLGFKEKTHRMTKRLNSASLTIPRYV